MGFAHALEHVENALLAARIGGFNQIARLQARQPVTRDADAGIAGKARRAAQAGTARLATGVE